MRCHRRGCSNGATRPGQLCVRHYGETPHGFVDPTGARAHLARLRAAGMGWDTLSRLTGLSLPTLHCLGRWTEFGSCTVDTRDRVLAVRIPNRLVDGGALVPAVGTARRIQGLMWLGWNQPTLAAELGFARTVQVSALVRRRRTVRASTAVNVAGVFDRLQWRVGSSTYPARFARSRGWFPPAAWDDIDDPDCTPDLGVQTQASFPERFVELREHCGLALPDIAARLGIDTDSVKQNLRRHKMEAISA